MSFPVAISLLRQLLLSVQEMHSRGIVHADIHPKNVLIKNTDLYLIDFELAKFAAQDEPNKIVRTEKTASCYYSPRQMKGFAASFSDDIFRSLIVGAILIGGMEWYYHCNSLERDFNRMMEFKTKSDFFEIPGVVSLAYKMPYSHSLDEIRWYLSQIIGLARNEHEADIGAMIEILDKLEVTVTSTFV